MKHGSWQILDVGSIWTKEFASALSGVYPVTAWSPFMSYTGALEDWQRAEFLPDPPLPILRFPLQRGYARTPLRQLAGFERALVRRMSAQCDDPADSPLICSTPFYAPVAELWPGPVIYYVTDLTVGYDGVDPGQVRSLDRRMCAVAKAVCPNSNRIADYLCNPAGSTPEKITVVPNATRQSNIPGAPLLAPTALPSPVAHLRRPVAGVIGNLAGNMDWTLLLEVIERTPELAWVFVGPSSMAIPDASQGRARAEVMQRATFTGARPYGELQSYARAFDVAVLPYFKKEPTYSGSSTRFYEHLAACRPMVATCGFAELLEKEPLVHLVRNAAEMADALLALRATGFRDGFEALRWEASRRGTWEERAKTLADTLPSSAGRPHASPVLLDALVPSD